MSQFSGSNDAEARQTVTGALYQLFRHPIHYFVINWNWKSALLSSVIRATIFLIATIKRGAWDISVAVAVEAVYSAFVSGIYGAFTQAMRFAKPEWVSKLIFGLILPLGLLGLDYLAHFYTGMRHMRLSLILSASFSALSSLFNLYIMRHGTLLVGHEGESLSRDLKRMPGLIVSFLTAAPVWMWSQALRIFQRKSVEIVT